MIDNSLLCESTYEARENTAPAPHSSNSLRASLIDTSPWARLFSSCEKISDSVGVSITVVLIIVYHLYDLNWWTMNRPFPSSLVPLFQNESKCETFQIKMSSACSFIFMQIKVIFIRMVSHLDSLWNRGTRELGNGLFCICSLRSATFVHLLHWSCFELLVS